MIEIRIHGRGGQGAKKSAQILARAFYFEGYKTQDFAIYGAERRGAPVVAFMRADKKAIGTRGYIFKPDVILILDDSLDLKKCIEGAKSNTLILINTHRKLNLKIQYNAVDATEAALKHLGKPIPNIALLGAFVYYARLISWKSFVKAVEIELAKYKAMVRPNLKAAKECYETAKKC